MVDKNTEDFNYGEGDRTSPTKKGERDEKTFGRRGSKSIPKGKKPRKTRTTSTPSRTRPDNTGTTDDEETMFNRRNFIKAGALATLVGGAGATGAYVLSRDEEEPVEQEDPTYTEDEPEQEIQDPTDHELPQEYEVSGDDLGELIEHYDSEGEEMHADILRSVEKNPGGGEDGDLYKFFVDEEEDRYFIRSSSTDQEVPEELYESAGDILAGALLVGASAKTYGDSTEELLYSDQNQEETTGQGYAMSDRLEQHAAAEGIEIANRLLEN